MHFQKAFVVIALGLLSSGVSAQLQDCNTTLNSIPNRATNPNLKNFLALAPGNELFHNLTKMFASQKKEVTIIAPTDSALTDAKLDASTLSKVLQQHVLPRFSAEPKDGEFMVYDSVLYEKSQWRSQIPVIVSRKGDKVTVGYGAAKTLDVKESIKCSNGVIHLVDGVMLPPKDLNNTLRDIGYSYFADLLVKTLNDTTISNTTTVYSAITNDGVFTQSIGVFVPPNSTFASVTLSGNDLSRYLKAHTSDWTPYSGMIVDGMQQYSKVGRNVTYGLTYSVASDGTIKVNGAKVTKADII
ncbi:hypothetical protein HK096_009772, partial [Nowakowskiella sp. JEL0078]